MKRRCGNCAKVALVKAPYTLTREFDGRTFAGEVPATHCEACGQTRVSGPGALAFERALVAELARGEVGPQAFRFLRRAAGLQGSRLAELLDVTPGTVSRWENGRKPLERRAVALVSALALEQTGGKTATRAVLEALAAGKKPPKRVRLDVSAAG